MTKLDGRKKKPKSTLKCDTCKVGSCFGRYDSQIYDIMQGNGSCEDKYIYKFGD